MKERPILMTPDNAQKCHDGTKTQTRRVIKPQPLHISWFEDQSGWCARVREDTGSAEHPAYVMVPCPYGVVGDQLWVREAFCLCGDEGSKKPLYRGQCEEYPSLKPIWKPSIHMPRWACRTVLEITDVRVERLQEIGEEDAIAEGVTRIDHGRAYYFSAMRDDPDYRNWVDPTDAYKELWESINGAGLWAQNPWVWVVAFRKVG